MASWRGLQWFYLKLVSLSRAERVRVARKEAAGLGMYFKAYSRQGALRQALEKARRIKKQMRDAFRKRVAACKKLGLCVSCLAPSGGHRLCAEHRARKNDRAKLRKQGAPSTRQKGDPLRLIARNRASAVVQVNFKARYGHYGKTRELLAKEWIT